MCAILSLIEPAEVSIITASHIVDSTVAAWANNNTIVKLFCNSTAEMPVFTWYGSGSVNLNVNSSSLTIRPLARDGATQIFHCSDGYLSRNAIVINVLCRI